MKNILFIIAAGVLLRILPHIPNMTPVGALALFGGVYLSRKQALILPILIMLVSDVFVGFHSTMVWVYGSFLLIAVLGIMLSHRPKPQYLLAASLGGSLLFYVVTNFGVWFSTGMYPKTIQGLIDCYVMAIPFLRLTAVGDLLYNTVFFGGFAIARGLLRRRAYISL